MQRPLEIRFRQMDSSPAIEARIRKKAAELERFSDRITGCRVTVEKAQRRHHQGNLFRVRIEIDAPGKEVAVTHTGPRDHAHEDVYVGSATPFARGAPARGPCSRAWRQDEGARGAAARPVRMVDHEADFGFIDTPEGEICFHRNSVVEGEFDDIAPGCEFGSRSPSGRARRAGGRPRYG